MSKVSSRALTSFKYVYLIVFFALLAGFFNPIITQTSFAFVIVGIIILFGGLSGGILLYKAAISEEKNLSYLAGGFTLIAVSLFFIFDLTGRT